MNRGHLVVLRWLPTDRWEAERGTLWEGSQGRGRARLEGTARGSVCAGEEGQQALLGSGVAVADQRQLEVTVGALLKTASHPAVEQASAAGVRRPAGRRAPRPGCVQNRSPSPPRGARVRASGTISLRSARPPLTARPSVPEASPWPPARGAASVPDSAARLELRRRALG